MSYHFADIPKSGCVIEVRGCIADNMCLGIQFTHEKGKPMVELAGACCYGEAVVRYPDVILPGGGFGRKTRSIYLQGKHRVTWSMLHNNSFT